MSTDILKRNNVRVFGRGSQPMMFAHGFGCDQTMWRHMTPHFEERYRIVLFDYVGLGESERAAYDPARYGTLDGYAQDVLDIVHALALTDVIFVGHSVSSMIGVLAANREPYRFSRLVMVCPSPRYVNDPPYFGGFERGDIEGLLQMMERDMEAWAGYLAPAVMKNPDRPELGRELARSFCAMDPAIARRFAEATFLTDNRVDLPRLRVPSLILQCSDDMVAPDQVGRYVHAHAPGSTFRQLRATGHCPHLSHPGETAALIESYLAQSAAA